MKEKLRDREWLNTKYTEEKLSCVKIKDLVGVASSGTVHGWLVKHNIPTRPRSIDWSQIEERECSNCHETKPIEEFAFRNKKTGRRLARCRACVATYHKEWYQKNKEAHIKNVGRRSKKLRLAFKQTLYEYLLEHPCVDCGETDPVVLEFDHVRGEKLADITRMGDRSGAAIQAEIAKCEVRCANCHRRKHFAGSYRHLRGNSIG